MKIAPAMKTVFVSNLQENQKYLNFVSTSFLESYQSPSSWGSPTHSYIEQKSRGRCVEKNNASSDDVTKTETIMEILFLRTSKHSFPNFRSTDPSTETDQLPRSPTRATWLLSKSLQPSPMSLKVPESWRKRKHCTEERASVSNFHILFPPQEN